MQSQEPCITTLELQSMDFLKKPKPQKKTKQFQGQRWFLTYPQNNTPKEIAMERLKERFKDNLKGVLIAQESHKDGNPHLHVMILLNKKLAFVNPSYFDFVCSKHGDYAMVKNVFAAVNYLHKQDQQPLSFGTIPDPNPLHSKTSASNEVSTSQKKLKLSDQVSNLWVIDFQ